MYDVGESIALTATQLNGDVAIDGCVGNEIARYEWTLSDNTVKAGRDIVHSFSQPGTYTIILITHEAVTGCRATCSVTLDVQ